MKTYSTFALYILSLLVFAASCDSKDDPTPAPGQGEEELIDTDYLRFSEVASTLFESDFTDTLKTSIKPRYGEALDPARPAFYSLAFESKEEAQQWFVNHCVPEEERQDVTIPLTGRFAVEFGLYGRLEYDPAGSAGGFGEVSIEIPGFEAQKKLEFIPKSLWPDNGGYSSHFYTGNIVRENETGRYYLCVTPCEGGHLGQLLNFDNEWGDDKYLVSYSDHWKTVKVRVGASEEAWNGLAQMYYKKDYFKAYWKDVQKRLPGCPLQRYRAINHLLYDVNESSRFPCKDTWGSRNLWWARKTWSLYHKYVYIGPNELQKENGGMPHFRIETKHIAAHAWYDMPSMWTTSHSETFNNDPDVLDRFTKVYEGEF